MKFIRNQKEYLILENYKKAKKLIEDTVGSNEEYGLSLNKNLKVLKELLKKNPNFIYTFMKFIIDENEDLTESIKNDNSGIDSVYGMINWIKNNKSSVKLLPKPLIEYDRFENLLDDVKNIIENRKYTEFPKILKYIGYSKEDIKEFEENNNIKIDSLAIKFHKLKKEEQEELTDKVKHYKVNNIPLKDFVKAFMSIVNRESEREDIIKSINSIKEEYNDDNTEIKYQNDKCLVLKTMNKELIQSLGSQKWCIVYSDKYFNDYCDPNVFNTQYIIFNFDDGGNDAHSMFGITLNYKGYPLDGAHQDKNNVPLSIDEISNICNIPKDVITPDNEKQNLEEFYSKHKYSSIDKILEDLVEEKEENKWDIYIKNIIKPSRVLINKVAKNNGLDKTLDGYLKLCSKYKDYPFSKDIAKLYTLTEDDIYTSSKLDKNPLGDNLPEELIKIIRTYGTESLKALTEGTSNIIQEPMALYVRDSLEKGIENYKSEDELIKTVCEEIGLDADEIKIKGFDAVLFPTSRYGGWSKTDIELEEWIKSFEYISDIYIEDYDDRLKVVSHFIYNFDSYYDTPKYERIMYDFLEESELIEWEEDGSSEEINWDDVIENLVEESLKALTLTYNIALLSIENSSSKIENVISPNGAIRVSLELYKSGHKGMDNTYKIDFEDLNDYYENKPFNNEYMDWYSYNGSEWDGNFSGIDILCLFEILDIISSNGGEVSSEYKKIADDYNKEIEDIKSNKDFKWKRLEKLILSMIKWI